jgi:hypothetical protein
VSDAVERIRAGKDAVRRSSGLWVRVRDDGRVRARVLAGGRYHIRPHLKGRLVVAGRGTSLRAVIYESYGESLVPGLFGGLAVFMAVVGVAIALAGDFAGPGLVVCGVAAVLFALLAYRLGRRRPTSFALEVKELERAVKRLVKQ